MISEKYIAGFLDADGCIGFTIHGSRNSLNLSFSQKTSQDRVLYLIQRSIGGSIDETNINGQMYARLTLGMKDSLMALSRIKKYLVLKRHYAEACLDALKKNGITREYMREQRRVKSVPIPNFPSRKWMAGYIDGDGCFSVLRIGKRGSVNIIFKLVSSNYDSEGIEVIHKAFGGRIHGDDRTTQYFLALPPSKAKQFLDFFCKYLVVKQDQALFILGCAKMGHYRDGKNIKIILKHLKAQEHRLNEPGADIYQLLKQVEDKPEHWCYKADYTECVRCHTRNSKHRCFGLCQKCFKEVRYKEEYQLMRQSKLTHQPDGLAKESGTIVLSLQA